MTQTIKRVAIYCRVSTSDQNCDRQVRDLQTFAERSGFEVVSMYKETASGIKNDRQERAKVLQLAQARHIDGILITEMTRWGRSLPDLINTMTELNSFGCSLIAQTGFQFDMSTPQGKMLAGILGSLAEFERDLLAERIKSGLANARARGRKLGRQPGQNPSDKHRKKVLAYGSEGKTVRWISKQLHLAPNTIQAIKKRAAA